MVHHSSQRVRTGGIRRRLVLASLLLAATAPVAAAQSHADRASLAGWVDSLDRATSLAALGALSRAAGAAPAVNGLRRASFVLRRAELRHEHGEMARAEFEDVWLATVHGDWPWTHYLAARALADEALAGWFPASTEDNKEGSESLGDSVWLELRSALDRDPELTAARRLADTLLVAGGDRLLRDDQVAIVADLLGSGPADPDAILVWGRRLRTMRQYDSAIGAFTDAIARGGDPSRLDLELARTYRAVHDTANAVVTYWRGLQDLTPAGRELYRFDLAWIISSDSLTAFDRLADSAVVPWMHRFWDERDAAAAARPGARLAEHLRRWAYAFGHFRVRSPWRRSMYDRIDMFYDNDQCQHFDAALYETMWKMPPVHLGDIRSRERMLDQRGIIYLRHGEPLLRVGGVDRFAAEDFSSGPPATALDLADAWSPWAKGARTRIMAPATTGRMSGVPMQMMTGPTESWVYLIDGDARLLTFRPSAAIGEYDATTLSSYLPYWPGEWLARVGTLDVYTAAAIRIAKELTIIGPPSPRDPPGCWDEIRAADDRSRADAAVASHNDSDSPPFTHPWASTIGIYALGDGADQTGEALLTFALGGRALHADTLPDGFASYRIAFHLSAWDAISGRSVSYDTTRTFRRRAPLSGDQLLVSWLDVPLPPGDWEIGVRAQQGDSSGGYAMRRHVQVGAGDRLGMSDIVTGRVGEPEWEATDGSPFPVATTGRWQEGSAAELFFEVHGVPAGQTYQTTLEVQTADSASRHALAPTIIHTTDLSTGSVTYVRRSLGLEHLAAGTYLMTVTVRWNGAQMSRSQRIVIRAAATAAPASQ